MELSKQRAMIKPALDTMTDEELFQASLLNLKHAVVQQSLAQRRVADRVRTLIRSLVVGLGSALVFILYLIYILTRQVEALSDSLDTVSHQAVAVQESMDDIEIVMINFETYMHELPEIDLSVTGVDKSMEKMTHHISSITGNISIVTHEFDNLQASMYGMGQQTVVLSQVLQQVTADVSEGTKPARYFNNMNPFEFMR